MKRHAAAAAVALALIVFGAFAIGAQAGSSGDEGATGNVTQAPSTFVQEQPSPQPDQPRRDREDCPEKDGGSGGGSQDGSSGSNAGSGFEY